MVLKDKQTKLHFHNGVMSIGGTVIEVEYKDSRIFFDFGTLYKPELNLENEHLETLVEYGLAPMLNHVYDPRLSGENPEENTFKHEAIFISHSHLDHTRMINYSNPAIPMYAMKETVCLLNFLNSDGEFLLPQAENKGSHTREMIGLSHGDLIEVGEIKVRALSVDHDTIGAMGLYIETPDLTIAYTGDYRFHGLRPELSENFGKAVKGVDILITEGVSVSFEDRPKTETDHDRPKTEKELFDRMVQILKENPDKQITFNAYEANPDRFLSFLNNGYRKTVLSAYQAQILKQCLNMDVLYYNDNRGMIHGLKPENEVSMETLLNDEGEYLWQYHGNTADLRGGGVYIHSDATPLGAFDPAYDGFVKGFENKEIAFVRLGCSGHAYPEDLNRMVDLAEAKILIPIHTLNPEFFKNPHGLCYLVENKEVI